MNRTFTYRILLGIPALVLTGTVAFAQLGVVVVPPGGPNRVSAMLLSASASAAITSCAFESKTQLVFEIDARCQLVTDALRDFSTAARSLPAPRQADFQTALQEVKAGADALQLSLDRARRANLQSWPEARANLASRYVAYIGTIVHAEKFVSAASVRN